MISQDLACKERVDIAPINIVYEPIFDENIPVPCFFTDQIHLAYIGRFDKGKEPISNRIVKQCRYWENWFSKNDEAMKKHLSICTPREGINYAFDNGQIIIFQGNFNYLADVPFTVYFDFETTTAGGSLFFFTQKCL